MLAIFFQKKQANIEKLKDQNQNNVNKLNYVKREARHFKNRKREYLKAKIDELETKSKNNNIRDLYRNITDIKKGCQLRTNRVKDENCDLLRCFG
jgi:BMFP domain-containing protein YqiC